MRSNQDVFCIKCGEKKKDYKPKVFYEPLLSSKKKKVFRCINHEPWIYFSVEIHQAKDAVSAMRIFVIHDKFPS